MLHVPLLIASLAVTWFGLASAAVHNTRGGYQSLAQQRHIVSERPGGEIDPTEAHVEQSANEFAKDFVSDAPPGGRKDVAASEAFAATAAKEMALHKELEERKKALAQQELDAEEAARKFRKGQEELNELRDRLASSTGEAEQARKAHEDALAAHAEAKEDHAEAEENHAEAKDAHEEAKDAHEEAKENAKESEEEILEDEGKEVKDTATLLAEAHRELAAAREEMRAAAKHARHAEKHAEEQEWEIQQRMDDAHEDAEMVKALEDEWYQARLEAREAVYQVRAIEKSIHELSQKSNAHRTAAALSSVALVFVGLLQVL